MNRHFQDCEWSSSKMATTSNNAVDLNIVPSLSSDTYGSKHDDLKRSPSRRRYHHRYFSVDRLGAYSDAVFSIIATFMIIPLSTAVEEFSTDQNIQDSLLEEWHLFVIYVISYFFVFSLWDSHVRVFDVVDHVGDTIIILNVIQLLVASMLPFLAALLGEYHADPLATLLFSCCLVAMATLQICMVFVAYRRKKMMSESAHKREIAIEFYASAGLMLSFAAISAVISYFSTIAAWAILGLALFSDSVSIILIAVYKRFFQPDEKYHTRGYILHRLVTSRSNPDRIKNFTDGVFAIVATLIILDLTNAVASPNNEESAAGSIRIELSDDKETFFSYFATFTTVGMLWYVHYTVFHPINKISRLTSLCNKWVLLFVGLLPMGFKLISKFSGDETDNNENVSVQLNCLAIFGASVSTLLTWVSTHWKRHKHLDDNYGRVHACWRLILLLVYPTISMVLFGVAFLPPKLDAYVIQSIQISVPFLFGFIKLCFEMYIHKNGYQDSNLDSTDDVELDDNDDGDKRRKVSVDTPL